MSKNIEVGYLNNQALIAVDVAIFTTTIVLNYNHGKVFQAQKAANFARRGCLEFLFKTPVTFKHRRCD